MSSWFSPGENVLATAGRTEISFDIRFLFAFPAGAFVSQKETRSIWEDQLSRNSKDIAGGSVMDGCAFAMRAMAIAIATPIHSDDWADVRAGAKGRRVRMPSRKGYRRTD